MTSHRHLRTHVAATGLLLALLAPLVLAEPADQDIRALYDGGRAFDHVVALADLGPRVAGTATERAAAQYIAAEFESYGLAVAIEEFPFLYFEDLGATLAVVGGAALLPDTMHYSPAGAFTAGLVDCGLGYPGEFPAAVTGKIALIQRGSRPEGPTGTFGFKTQNAAAAGAVAAIIYNNRPGGFSGTLGGVTDIPAVSISAEEGQMLLGLLAAGPVVVDLSVQTVVYEAISQNVIGTLAGLEPAQGTVYIGGHYDSAAPSPGANDDASGVGAVLEAARAMTTGHRTKATMTFLAFGAEEAGLHGSLNYVLDHEDEIARQGLGMINLDMIGVGDALMIGNMGLAGQELTALGQDKATLWDLAWEPFLASANSDHTYFEQSGVPVLYLYQDPDPNYHTPNDRPEHFNLEAYENNGELAAAALYDWAKNPALRARKAALSPVFVHHEQVYATE